MMWARAVVQDPGRLPGWPAHGAGAGGGSRRARKPASTRPQATTRCTTRRTLVFGTIMPAAVEPYHSGSATCAPLLVVTALAAAGAASWRTLSTHGPARARGVERGACAMAARSSGHALCAQLRRWHGATAAAHTQGQGRSTRESAAPHAHTTSNTHLPR
jgi:hypothetical protein